MASYIIALDQGTTSSRSLVINHSGEIIASAQKEFTQIFPKPGWVEHDPKEILETQLATLSEAIEKAGIAVEEIASIGITNQRETTVVWNKNTGEPVYNAILWQDRRTADFCESLKAQGLDATIKAKTGLVIDAYFSGTKVNWILEEVEGARELAENGDLLFGTIDTWLLWNMTNRQSHKTDYTNASRTLLYNIKDLSWDAEMCSVLKVPMQMLPEVQASSSNFGSYEYMGQAIPIGGIAGDQQAALFGQTCFDAGEAKNTYGTGCFLLMNTGEELRYSDKGLLTTLICGTGDRPLYGLEGSIFVAGAAIQWLRDGIKIIEDAKETEAIALSIKDQHDVVVVPAFAGLGTPYWDMYARGTILGITRGTERSHIIKATIDSLAYQTKDILETMVEESGVDLQELKVDGGACANNYLMQFQADILGTKVERPSVVETTALGAAYLAGLQSKFWSEEEIKSFRKIDRTFTPEMEEGERHHLYARWKKAIAHAQGWLH